MQVDCAFLHIDKIPREKDLRGVLSFSEIVELNSSLSFMCEAS